MNNGGFETLHLATDLLCVEIIPALGGKIASMRVPRPVWPDARPLLDRPFAELLQSPLQPYALRSLTMPFDASDASGFDECLPSVSACVVEHEGRRVEVPDHGEFWRLPWTVLHVDASSVELAAEGSVLPLRFVRRLRIGRAATGAVTGAELAIDYSVENTGPVAVPYAWSAHPLFAVDAGDRIHLPGNPEITVEGSAGQRLGPSGAKHTWPHVTLPTPGDGSAVDLSVAQDALAGIGDKLYTAAPAEGWCALDRLEFGKRITLRFDPTLCPWLGLWLCYGGWPEAAAQRQQAVALEPCNAPVDSLAEAVARGAARRLQPGGTDRWTLQISVSDIR